MVRGAGGRAAGAQADDREVREPRGQPEPVTNLGSDRVKIAGLEYGHTAAALAVEKLAVLAAGQDVQAGTVAEVDVAGEPVLLEHLEVAIDRRLLER